MKKIIYICLITCFTIHSQSNIGSRMLSLSQQQFSNESAGGAIDYINYLEVDADIESDFTFTNRAGTYDVGLFPRNTNGEWCLETTGATASGDTGATANPVGRIAYVYNESSSPSGSSSLWSMTRNISFDTTSQDLYLDIIYNLKAVSCTIKIEYATVASPNTTTDWTTLETINSNNTDAWVSDTFDFSVVPATTTLWIRINLFTPNTFTSDLSFSTWREYSVLH